MNRLATIAFAAVTTATALVVGAAPTAVAHASSSSRAVYEDYGCVACHGDDGHGICDLRAANDHLPTDAALRAFIDRPSALHPGSKMPSFRDVIAEDDYPLLIEHVRELSRNKK